MSATDQTADGIVRLAPGVKIALAIAAAGFLAVCVWLTWVTPVLTPYSDMLDWVARYLDFRGDHNLAAYLFTPHISHRLVATFLVLWADAGLFGAHGWLFVIVGVGALALTAGLLGKAAAQAAQGDMAWVIGAAAAGLTLGPGGFLDATLHICTIYVEALAFMVGAILLASPAGEEAPSPGRLILALACAVAAAFCNGVGLAVWPVLAFAAWRRNRMLGQAILVGGVLFALAYFAGQAGGSALHAPQTAGGGGLRRMALMFFSYLGLPLTWAVPRLGWALGLILAGLSGWAILRRGRHDAPRAERVAVQLIQLSLVTAAMAAVGRNDAALPTQAPLRYAVFLSPLHVGLLMLAAPALQKIVLARPRQTQALLVASALGFTALQLGAGVFVARTADINRARIAAFKSGDRSAPVLAVMYPDAAKAQAMRARMAAAGVYQDN
jgi:hypothetical protein